ncbi:MAG: leucyl/phenylalanyl-tRNA--protein transferase [Bacteroidales bacterium]
MEYIIEFPNPESAGEEGLLAVGGELTPEYLISAYSNGIFPWFGEGDPILWWSPNPRLVLFPGEFKLSKSLAKTIKNKIFTYKTDNDFESVIKSCSLQPRKGQDGTWITKEMIDAYLHLHRLGIAHSFEVYRDGKLAGGLYGVSLGKAFFGESMFHLITDASKVAFYFLVEWCLKNEIHFIDCQQPTGHLISLGAREISRKEFLSKLKQALEFDTLQGKWTEI